MPSDMPSQASVLDSGDASLFDVRTRAAGPQGRLPYTEQMLRERPSGDLYAGR
jgi:hypothetical protein